MKYIGLMLFLLYLTIAGAQDTAWTKYNADTNLSLDLPGAVSKPDTVTINNYTYKIVYVRKDSAMYTVMVTTTEAGLRIYDNEKYKAAISELARGAASAPAYKNANPVVYDIVCDNVPGKKLVAAGNVLSIPTKIVSYLFIVNDFVYSINCYRYDDKLPEENADFHRIIASINFTDDIKEINGASKTGAFYFSKGKLTGFIIIVAIIILGVVWFVRKL